MSWEDYKGIAGYNQMIGEIRQSVSAEFPEAKGRLYIYNQLEPTSEEIQRVAGELGVENPVEQINEYLKDDAKEYQFPKTSGIMIPLKNRQGKEVYLAMGWHPSDLATSLETGKNEIGKTLVKWTKNHLQEDSLTPKRIAALAWNNLHEAGHGLQHITNVVRRDRRDENGNGTVEGVRTELTPTYWESGAEVFSRALLVHNGMSPQQWAYEPMAHYDAQHVSGVGRYDPSKPLLAILNKPDATKKDTFESYRLSGVREVFNAAHDETKKQLGNHAEQYHHVVQINALNTVTEELTNKSLSESNKVSWIAAHDDSILQANQIKAGSDYQKNPVGEYKGSETPDFSLEQAASRAWLRYQATKNPVDEKLAKALLNGVVDLDDVGIKPELHLQSSDVNVLMKSDKWKNIAERMAKGEPIEKVAPELEKFVAVTAPQLSYVKVPNKNHAIIIER
jgi:hypothetical protein